MSSAKPLTAEEEQRLRDAVSGPWGSPLHPIARLLATLDAARLSQESSARAAGWREGVEAAASWLTGWREEDPPEYLTIDDWRWLGRKREGYAAAIRAALLPPPPTEAGEDTLVCTDDRTGEIVGRMVDVTGAFLEEEAAQQPAAPICTCGRLREGTRLTQNHERGCPLAQQKADIDPTLHVSAALHLEPTNGGWCCPHCGVAGPQRTTADKTYWQAAADGCHRGPWAPEHRKAAQQPALAADQKKEG